MSALLVVYGDPDVEATIETHRAYDPDTGVLHEAYLWECRCGARGQTGTMHDAQVELRLHRYGHPSHHVTIDDAIAEALGDE